MADTAAVRTALLALHRELLEAQRIDAERFGGRMSAADVLQAAIDDPKFDWLRTLSELVTQLDGAESEAEAEAVADRVRGLLAPPDEGTPFGRQYLRALQRHPGVVLAHRD